MGICEVDGWFLGAGRVVFWFLAFEKRGLWGLWRGRRGMGWEKGEGFQGWGDEKRRGDQRE